MLPTGLNPIVDPSEGPDWLTLCECTKSPKPAYVVTNLTGNTTYFMNIQAVNKVGFGDEHVFEVSTSPMKPDPPIKPWIEEARDGCLCVAWKPPEADGGAQITAYKVRMRKLLGASKYNLFGPAASSGTWVDMGTIGAAMNEKAPGEPAVYTAWVGPLEAVTCEYCFQATALNRAGVSEPSELSDPYYT